MGTNTTTTVVAAPPKNFYYLAIDGTNAKDSAAFGAFLENNTGWKNLATHFLKPAPELATRLVDPAHPFLPIHVVEREGRKVAVVCPGGLNCEGLDKFWNKYPGDAAKATRSWPKTGRTTYGRHTACEESAEFIKTLILNPVVEVVKKGAASETRLANGAPAAGAEAFAADLVYMSSHGWLGGFMRGELCQANPAAEPAQAQGEFFPNSPYFLVGEAAANGRGFHGPTWVVLAQCSTLNSAAWPLWVKVLEKSSPHVRGILGYEEASPDASSSVGIARRFFEGLKAGKTFLDAWIAANPPGVKWAAVVHNDARQDKMSQWGKFAPLKSVATTTSVSSYKGYLTSIAAGEKIFDSPEPFTLNMLTSNGAWEVKPENLDSWHSAFRPGQPYSVKVSAPSGQTLKSVKLDWIHIRPTHPHQFACDKLFEKMTVSADADLAVDKAKRTKLVLTAKKPVSSLQVDLRTRSPLSGTGLEAHHAYLWIRAEITTDKGTLTHDFRTRGLLYYGEF